MGPDGVLPLAKALTNQSSRFIALNALEALELTDANTEAAVPALLCVLTNADWFSNIENAFVNARAASNAVFPVMQVAIGHTNWSVRETALATLQVLETGHARDPEREYVIRMDNYGNYDLF